MHSQAQDSDHRFKNKVQEGEKKRQKKKEGMGERENSGGNKLNQPEKTIPPPLFSSNPKDGDAVL